VLLDEMGVEFRKPDSIEDLQPYTWGQSIDPFRE